MDESDDEFNVNKSSLFVESFDVDVDADFNLLLLLLLNVVVGVLFS